MLVEILMKMIFIGIERNACIRDENDFHFKHARNAAKTILRHNMDDEDPNVNGFPTQPFQPEMTNDSMAQIFQSVTESDFIEMNNGDQPVDSPDFGNPVSIDELKSGWPVYMSPGKYVIAVGNSADKMNYVVGKKTGKLYVFDFGIMAQELKDRREV